MDPWNSFLEQVRLAVRDSFGSDVEIVLEVPRDEKLGDISTPVCFSLAKVMKKPPKKIAEEFKFAREKCPLIEKAEAVNGYLNFFVDWDSYALLVLKTVMEEGDGYGRSKSFQGNVLVEFPAVNPNKPWHIGHARNAVLGDTLSNILEAVGYSVIRADYIDDLGLQVAKALWGTKNFPVPEGKYDQVLGRLYVDVEEAMKQKPEIEKQVRDIVRRMEEGDNEVAREARRLAEDCVRAQYQTAFAMNVFHDLMVWESDIVAHGLLKRALEEMLRSKHIRKVAEGEKAGCIIADLSEFPEFKDLKDVEKVLIRSDGTAVYTAKDIAFQMWKFGLFEDPFSYEKFMEQPNGRDVWSSCRQGEKGKFSKADMVINVIGAEQSHPQRLVYLILKLMGYERQYEKSFHIAYEHVWLPTGKFSGRKGTWIGHSTDEVLEEACERARAEIEKRDPDLGQEEKEKTSKAVGYSAVRYVLLKYDPEKKITFVWEEALSFDGNAAPYLQYAHARACRILEKAPGAVKPPAEKWQLNEYEKDLLRRISKLPGLLVKVASGMKKEVWGTSVEINQLAEYAFQLATSFNQFYACCRVIGSEDEKRRLAIVKATQQTLKNALNVLGVNPVEKM